MVVPGPDKETLGTIVPGQLHPTLEEPGDCHSATMPWPGIRTRQALALTPTCSVIPSQVSGSPWVQQGHP